MGYGTETTEAEAPVTDEVGPEWAMPRPAGSAVIRERSRDEYALRPNGLVSEEEAEEVEELAREISTLAADLTVGEHEFLVRIAKYERRKGWKIHGYRNCVDFLQVWAGLDARTARERLRVARKLDDFPQVSAAMRRGRLSFSKVRAIVRLDELSEEDEATIVGFAEKTTAAEVERLVRQKRTLGREDEEERERRRHARRRLAVFPDGKGMYDIRGKVAPEVGALLMRLIEAASDEQYAMHKEEALGPELPDAPQRRADALSLIAERALAAGFGKRRRSGPAGPEAGDADGDTASGPAGPEEEAAAAPAGGSDSGCGCSCEGEPANLKGTRPERYQVFVHLDEAALARVGTSECSHLEDGTRLPTETARRLTCDASIVPVVRDGSDSPLDIGRKTRTIPPAIERALRIRDGGCRFPGCGLRFTDGHHVEHWVCGGETKLDNLVSLCAFHHRAVHEDGFRVESRGKGKFSFYTPEGWPLGREGPHVDIRPDDPRVGIVRRNRRLGISPRWHDPKARYDTEARIPDRLLLRAWEIASG